jgi:hypothetical protein
MRPSAPTRWRASRRSVPLGAGAAVAGDEDALGVRERLVDGAGVEAGVERDVARAQVESCSSAAVARNSVSSRNQAGREPPTISGGNG